MSLSDEMDPKDALATMRDELTKNSAMNQFEEIIVGNEHDGLVYMHDFAEALEDCNINCTTSLLRQVYKLLKTSEEDDEAINRYVLISAVKTGAPSAIRAKIFQSQHQRKRSYPNLENKNSKIHPTTNSYSNQR